MRLLALSLPTLLLLSLGCGSSSVPPVARVKVSGKVEVDGKPLATGKISFDANNGQPPASLDINSGAYSGVAPVGKCKVRITSSVAIDRSKEKTKPQGPGADTATEGNNLPAKYNSSTELEREITEPGPHQFDFPDLKMKEAATKPK
jgi:hypothetical protein